MFLVGLTGGIASGKSSVIQVFQQLGCAVVDVDVIARQGQSEGQAVGLCGAARASFLQSLPEEGEAAPPFSRGLPRPRGREGFPPSPV